MSVIGTFKANGNEFTGAIATLTIQASDVRIVPVKRTTNSGPSLRVYAGRSEIGAAWNKKSKDGRGYLSVLLDDPTMTAAFYASLVSDEQEGGHILIWSRGTRHDRD